MLVPVAGNVEATGNPHVLMLLDMRNEPLKGGGAARPAGKAAVQSHRHHLRGAVLPLLIEYIESIAQIGEKLVAGIEPLGGGEAHVVGVESVRHDEMAAFRPVNPVWQVIGIRIRRIKKTALFHDKLQRVNRTAAGIPAKRPLAGDFSMRADGPPHMTALLGGGESLYSIHLRPWEAISQPASRIA